MPLSLLAVVGLFISLGEMLGCLHDKDRINFLKIIEKELEFPKDNPVAVHFINDFVYSNLDYGTMNI